jgi:hypothetical protein
VKKNDGQEVLRNFAQTIPDFINGIDPSATSADKFCWDAQQASPRM